MPKPPPREGRDWVTTPEAAAIFEVTTETIRDWIAKGKLRATQPNGYFRITNEEIARRARVLYEGQPELPFPPTTTG